MDFPFFKTYALFQIGCSKTSSIVLEKISVPRKIRETFIIEWRDRFYTQKFRIEVTAQYKDTTFFFQEEFKKYFHELWYSSENLLRHEMRWDVKMNSRWGIFKPPFSISFIIAILYTLSRPFHLKSYKILLHCFQVSLE